LHIKKPKIYSYGKESRQGIKPHNKETAVGIVDRFFQSPPG
jgi:hypothetical protein